MERGANYALVGVLTTALIMVGLVFAVWLGGFSSGGQDRYRVIFKGPVSGLSDGGEVQFNGIKVGEIEHVDLAPQDATLVAVDIKVKKGTPVRVDSVANSAMQGISGVNAVAISAGTTGRPLLKETTSSDRPIIRGEKSGLASLMDSGGAVVEGANQAIGRVNRLLSDKNIAALSMTMQDVHSVTSELAANRAMIDHAASAIDKLDQTATDVQEAARSARQLIDGDGRQTMTNIAGAAGDLRLTLRDARGVIAKLNGSAGDIGPSLNTTLITIQQASESLDGLVRQIRSDPRGTLGKSRGKELELPK